LSCDGYLELNQKLAALRATVLAYGNNPYLESLQKIKKTTLENDTCFSRKLYLSPKMPSLFVLIKRVLEVDMIGLFLIRRPIVGISI
jgi:hypothetical protein